MAFNDCVDGLFSEGQLSQETADAAKRKFKEFSEDGQGKLSWHEREQRAAQRVEADLDRARMRRKRARSIQAKKQAEISERLALAPAGQKEKAALAVLDIDPKSRFTGDNVAIRHEVLRKFAFGLMSDFLDRYRSRTGGATRDVTGMRDVVKGLFGENTTPQAKAFADSIHEARQYLRVRHNQAGGDIVQRENWGWVQKHDREAMAAVSKEDWVEFTLPRVDPEKMVDAAGVPMTARQVREALEATYDEIVTGGLEDMARPIAEDFASPITRRVHHREIVFRDAEMWLQYQERFGSGDILSAIVGELDRLARDTALIEVMGPYPRATLTAMKGAIDRDLGEAAAAGSGPRAARLARRIGTHRFLDAVFDTVSGAVNLPASAGWARTNQATRNLITSARLGSAIFISVGDVGTTTLTAKFNGIPQTRLIREIVGQLSPRRKADRRMAARMGFIADTWTGDLISAQRIMGDVGEAANTARIAETTLRLSGLSAWTEGVRNAFRLAHIGHLTEEAFKPWQRIDPTLKAGMERYGITEADWERFRSTPIWTDPETKAEFIRPEDVYLEFGPGTTVDIGERAARFETAQKFNNMIATEASFAVIAPTARSRAVAAGGTAPGSMAGELVRNFMLFKSFMVAFTHMHGARALMQPDAWSKIGYFGWATIGMTLAGALATQSSQVLRGKDPLDMGEARFWGTALMRGGALGPIGDFLYADVNRFGHGLTEALAGPVAATISDGWKAGPGNLQEFVAEGEMKGAAREFRRFVEGLTPGNSLWYTRLAFERMVKDQLESMADPDSMARYRRAERFARREFNQNYWWRPGEFLPE